MRPNRHGTGYIPDTDSKFTTGAQRTLNPKVEGSIPSWRTTGYLVPTVCDTVAQSVEQRPFKPLVVGSIPTRVTNINKA